MDELVELGFIDRLSVNVKGKNKIVFKFLEDEVDNEENEEEVRASSELREEPSTRMPEEK